ncbi:uncharacterized protein [Leptinotarsa decemlineata]|uniref:uncharacterized protein n=1 Tax=Leptinotarsa decemlineata TaxID=7539 RepID=UPI003D309054
MDENTQSDENINAKTLGLFFFQSMKKYKSHIFQYIAETGKTNTYGEMLTRCVRIALNLRDKGFDKNDIISTCSPNSENSCLPTIAIQFLGAKSTYFDPNLSPLDTVHLLDLIRPKLMFVSQDALTFMENCLAKANIEVEIVVIGTSVKYEQFSKYLAQHNLEMNSHQNPI